MYIGYSMSVNAYDAYQDGLKPWSKWTKENISEALKEKLKEYFSEKEINILLKYPLKVLKKVCLTSMEWHHTSKFYNETDFYEVDERLQNLTFDEILTLCEKEKEKVKEQTEVVEKWECRFLEWGGTRKHPKATEKTEIGEIKGNWFYRADGTKKSINANGFCRLRKI